jgi:hypothetical protein
MPTSDGTQTALERVVAYEAAIAAISGGLQSYTVMGQTFSRASLATLHRMLNEARREYLASTGAKPGAARITLGDAF